MREMKNSGVAWIGEIPKDWKISKIKNISVSLKSGGTPDSSKDEFYVDKEVGIPWVAIADMSDKPYITYTQKYITEEARKSKNLTIFEAGTILYAMYASVGKVSVLGVKATINQALLAISLKKGIDDAYCTFALNAWEPYIISESNGTTQFNLNANKVANLQIPMPPENRQRIISDCINGNCVKVDSLIANVQAQIEKLKAYKQSLITEVVTKGLDPNAPMKDSGVEWIGKIPAHWGTAKLQYCAELRSGITLGKKYPKDIKLVERPYLRVANVQSGGVTLENIKTVQVTEEEDAQYRLTAGEVLMTEGGDRDKLGRGCVWNGQIEPCLHQNHIFALRTSKNLDPQFLSYVTASKIGRVYFDITAIKTTNLACTNSSKVLAFKLSLPPITEQQRITVHLNNKCSQIEQLISLKESKIEKLQQYKRSLIYEYVTGKKEVV